MEQSNCLGKASQHQASDVGALNRLPDGVGEARQVKFSDPGAGHDIVHTMARAARGGWAARVRTVSGAQRSSGGGHAGSAGSAGSNACPPLTSRHHVHGACLRAARGCDGDGGAHSVWGACDLPDRGAVH